VSVVHGANLIGSYAKTERSIRKWCARCGGHLFTEHPHWGLVDVYATVLRASVRSAASRELRRAHARLADGSRR
jgi:hypothetical protein